jgi:hypothetical protein
MMEYVKHILAVLPRSHANVIIFGTLTGLRPIEACKSVQIIQTNLPNYLNSELFILEHFKWKDIFIRRTKKAFISVMTDRLLEIAKSADYQSYTSIYVYLRKRGLPMRMNYCRKSLGHIYVIVVLKVRWSICLKVGYHQRSLLGIIGLQT